MNSFLHFRAQRGVQRNAYRAECKWQYFNKFTTLPGNLLTSSCCRHNKRLTAPYQYMRVLYRRHTLSTKCTCTKTTSANAPTKKCQDRGSSGSVCPLRLGTGPGLYPRPEIGDKTKTKRRDVIQSTPHMAVSL